MTVHFLIHASFLIVQSNMNIYIDPYNLNKKHPLADFIFITHSHYDHLSVEDIKKILKPETVLIAPSEAESKLKSFKNKKVFVEPNKIYEIDSISVLTVPAYNLNKNFHPKANKWCGYILKFKDGSSFFHTGDSDNIPEYSKLANEKISVMAVCCGGTYTMNWKEAVEATKIVKPKEVIPMHWGAIVGSLDDAKKFSDALKDSGIKVNILSQEE